MVIPYIGSRGDIHHRDVFPILSSLKKYTTTPEKYIKCFGLRNHGKMKSGKPVTELIYIHSKVYSILS
jgi:hypothetical protein